MIKHQLYWDEETGPNSYALYVRKQEQTELTQWRNVNVHQGISVMLIPAEVPGILYGDVVFVVVVAVDDWGQDGLLSEELQVKIPLPAPQNVRVE